MEGARGKQFKFQIGKHKIFVKFLNVNNMWDFSLFIEQKQCR